MPETAEPKPEFDEKTPLPTPVIDTDVHEKLPSAKTLLPYLAPEWHRSIIGGWSAPNHFNYGAATETGFMRPDAIPEKGPAGSDLDLMRAQLLDEHNMEVAILTSLFFPGDMQVQFEFGNALASAYNDWLTEEWLAKEPRLRASIIINTSDPEAAAREIDRVAERPEFVQVILGPSTTGYGEKRYDPIFKAADRHDLAVALHPSSRAMPAFGSGYPEYLAEWRTLALPQHIQAQLISIIFHGVFERYPNLRMTVIEAGWTWLPHVMWRAEENRRSMRWEVPWLKRSPKEYVRDHVRFTTQPIEDLTLREFESIVELIGGDELLFYASDYPHWDFDTPTRAFPEGVSEESLKRMRYTNAKDWYRL